MRIVVLGGAGDVGSQAVEDLVVSDGVELVTIADRDQQAARALASRLRPCPARVEVAAVDANDHAALVGAMQGHDVAASALGPFYLFERKLVRAAIDAGVDYASVCDDYSAVEEVMDGLDEEARDQGCVAITGLGVSPGISNAAIRLFADQMDQVRRADVSVYQPLDGGGEAVIRHVLFIMSGRVAGWRGGQACRVPACSQQRFVEFPRFGRIPVWNMGHSEPVSVPRSLPGVDEVNFFMGYGRGARLLVEPARRGLFDRKWSAEITVKVLSAVERLLPESAPKPGALRIEVWGEKYGIVVYRMACGVGEMRAATGLSLSVGTLQLGRRQLTTSEGGVYAPEGCLDPRLFLSAMRDKGIAAFADLEMTRPLP